MLDVLISGGPVMIPLGILSLVAVAIAVERFWVLRKSRFVRPDQVSALNNLLVRREYRSTLEYCRRHSGPMTALVAALVENRHAPYEELREILEDTGRHQLSGLQRGLQALATIVSGSPLLGLLGTVLGMIQIFTVVGSTGTSTIAEQLSAGIAQALITTATGLIIAVPALFIHSYLESRAIGILDEIEAQMLDFLHLVRRPETDNEEEGS